MALFFNKQRRSIITSTALSSYLKYALGEIVLVVIGILIALQINDWYQQRLDRQIEREYLVSMKRDLAEDASELVDAIDGNSSLLAGLDDTLRLLADPRDDDGWRRDLYTLMYQRQLHLAQSLSTLIEAQYGIHGQDEMQKMNTDRSE